MKPITKNALDAATVGFVPVAWVHSVTGRKQRTIRTWVRLGQVRSETRQGVLYVHAGDAMKLARTAARRRRETPGQAPPRA